VELTSSANPGAVEDLDREWREGFAECITDNDTFNHVIQRAMTDLRMLWTKDETGSTYMAAGTPWFSTLFGRDSIIVALQTLPFMPALARDCLTLLAAGQGRSLNPFRNEEPGKILHERRRNELSNIGELPYGEYYGSVDSTPLFLLLAAEYCLWTGDQAFFAKLRPALDAALLWLERYGDLDSDGFLEYRTDSPDGLRNQGWKDSTEAVMHADGALCEGPIALAEVQSYMYAAYRGLAQAFTLAGETELAASLDQRATRVQDEFRKAFWLSDRGYVAMGLDGSKRPTKVMSSNAGQVLWSRILGQESAMSVANHLMSPAMFSGWGIRTLADDSIAYNPLGYHLGTVWPHDNAIIASGLKQYGADQAVDSLFSGLFDAVKTWPDYRLPELFGGHPRSLYSRPVPYPVACRPQAWTSGAWFQLIQTALGMNSLPHNPPSSFVRPQLPSWINEIRLNGILVNNVKSDLRARRVDGETVVFVNGERVSPGGPARQKTAG